MADVKNRNVTKRNKKTVLRKIAELMKTQAPKGQFTETVGRRKTATARVRLYEAKSNSMTVNGIDVKEYFKTDRLTGIAMAALESPEVGQTYQATVLVKGSGQNAQAESVRLGVARALVELNEDLRSTMKHAGFLKRDPRSVERKKFGLRKARKAPTWVKR